MFEQGFQIVLSWIDPLTLPSPPMGERKNKTQIFICDSPAFEGERNIEVKKGHMQFTCPDGGEEKQDTNFHMR
jgi:hypothetical protein